MDTDKNTATIFLGRHCKTQWNLEDRLIGTTDLPLCEYGKKEAVENIPKIKDLNVGRIICSNLKRAVDTASTYSESLGIQMEISAGLREIDHGTWNGIEKEKLLKESPEFRKFYEDDPTTVPIPNGTEEIVGAQERIKAEIRRIALGYPGERVLVIMHKHIRSILTCTLQDIPLSHFKENINESVVPFEIPQDQLSRIL